MDFLQHALALEPDCFFFFVSSLFLPNANNRKEGNEVAAQV